VIGNDFNYGSGIGSNWWCVHLVSCFQGEPDRDNDPESEGAPIGGEAIEEYHGAVIYKESLRDYNPAAEGTIVVHELGHCTGPDHSDGWVMDPVPSSNQFSDVSLDKIRDKTW